jgi:hypothetical protein
MPLQHPATRAMAADGPGMFVRHVRTVRGSLMSVEHALTARVAVAGSPCAWGILDHRALPAGLGHAPPPAALPAARALPLAAWHSLGRASPAQ